MTETALITGASSGIGTELAKIHASRGGDLVVVNDASLNFMLNWVVPLMPRNLLLKVSRRTMEKSQ